MELPTSDSIIISAFQNHHGVTENTENSEFDKEARNPGKEMLFPSVPGFLASS
jgi:hypothetical protein